jgi:hypothetical protein
MERNAADARGPFELGQLSSILAGRQASGVSLGRHDSQALGRGHKSAAADAQGPFELGLLSSILAGRQAGGVSLGRQDSQALGRGHGSAAADTQSWYNDQNPFILYFGPTS